ncbi:porin [Trinickia mobilis]|uniref:porin n=1 Tax=Trinickia mobilis TaxID=2816356 RepID=UPI001A8E0824|nr:porin [Trinickia mobilis]
MKRLCLLSICMAMCPISHAQSSVTLYGRLDSGLEFQTGLPHGHLLSTQSGNLEASELGLQGIEDLGGGLAAIFNLTMGIDVNDGSTLGDFWGRGATVGLRSDRWGTFRMGYIGVHEIAGDSFDVDPERFQWFGISTLVRGRNWSEAGNALEYQSPEIHGLFFKGQYDLTNSPAWNAGNPGSGPGTIGQAQGRSDGLEVGYSRDPAHLRVIYDEIRDPNGNFSNVYTASRSLLAGVTYEIDPVTLYAGYQHLSAPAASNQGYFGSAPPPLRPQGVSLPATVDYAWLGALWKVTPFTWLTSAVYHANANGGNGNATLFTSGATYALSKRTFLYTELGYVWNSSTSNIGLGNGFSDPYGANSNDDPVHALPFNTNPNFGHGQFGASIGIVANF